METLKSASLPSYKTPATFIDSMHPNNHPGKSKESRDEIQLPINPLHTQNPELREVDLESSPKRGSDCDLY